HLLVESEVRADRKRDPLPTPRILKAAQFHNSTNRTVAGRVDIGKLEVMHTPIDPVNDGKCRTSQLIIKPPGHETTDDGFAMGFALERPGRRCARRTVSCERLMQPLDDVAAFPKCTQALFGVSSQDPARGSRGLGEPHPLKRPHPS